MCQFFYSTYKPNNILEEKIVDENVKRNRQALRNLFKRRSANDNLLIFDLEQVSEEEKSMFASSLPTILVQPDQNDFANFADLSEDFNYKLCKEISNYCGEYMYIIDPNSQTQTLILDRNNFCKLVQESDVVLDQISNDLSISK